MLTEGRVTVQTYRAEGHPHLNPLPSRARRGRGGLGAPQRADTWVRPYDWGVTLTPALSRRGRGGLGAPRRADTWVRPYDWGVTLTPALSRRGRGGMGAPRRADTWVRPYDRGLTLTPALSRRGPVKGEEGDKPHRDCVTGQARALTPGDALARLRVVPP